MSIPVLITDGNSTLTLKAGKLPVDVDFTGVTVNATFPSTVNVSITGSKDVTGNVAITGNVNIGTVNSTVNTAVTNNVVIDNIIDTVNVSVVAISDDIVVASIGSTVNVAIIGTPNVAVTNTANVAVLSAPTVNVTVLNNDDIHPSLDSGLFDAFGRTRTSHPYTLFQSMLVADDGSLSWNEAETGTANESTSAWEQNLASVILTVNATQNTQRVRQTFERFAYQPGKSQQVMMTFVMGTPTANVTKEIGYGDEFDGLFLRSIGTVAAFTRRTRTSGSTVETTINQIDWNIDTMNGAGASGMTIDWTKTQILFVDFEWLGVGRARMGFVIDGKIIYAHAFNNANSLSTVYMRTPVLPLRYKIGGNGSQTGNHTLTCICAAVATEGGEQVFGRLRTTSTGNVAIVPTSNWTILKAIRGGSGGKSTRVCDIEIEVLCTDTNASAEFALILAPVTNGGALTYGAISGSQIEAATGNAAQYATVGTILHTGYVAGRSADIVPINARVSLGYNIAGVARELMLCARLISGTPDLHAAINWVEV